VTGHFSAALPPLSTPPPRAGAPARFGAANVLRGLRASRTGEVVNLNLDINQPEAPFGRPAFRRSVRLHNQIRPLGDGRYMVINDDEAFLSLQGSSQWDSFAHFGVIEPGSPGVYHGGAGLEETFPAASAATLGIEALGAGILTRGVLLDCVAAFGDGADFLDPSVAMTRAMIEDVISAQEVEIEAGDAVLIYTGLERRRARLGGAWPRDCAGLLGDTVALWTDLDILALISDNLGIDVTPGTNVMHAELLCRAGIPFGELWALDSLAQRLRAEQRWEFLLASVPLSISGAFGSPANAVAVL
jgi:kynurenine formamidase